jgi:23S rRNA pseudouridine2605 synthase
MRLNKYIAQAGAASRRQADELTRQGKVKINGAVMRTLGYDVQPGDVVTVDGKKLSPENRAVYILLNKPPGFVTTVSDERERPTVMELVNDIPERIYPVGRLDINTAGLLIMTNDGDFAARVTHPKHAVVKTYRARVAGVMSKERLAALRRGVDIGGYVTAPAGATLIRQSPNSALVELKIREGKNRQVRKMFEAVGNKVLELERTAVGSVYLGNLKSGHYRKLKRSEIESLTE